MALRLHALTEPAARTDYWEQIRNVLELFGREVKTESMLETWLMGARPSHELECSEIFHAD